MSTLTAPSFYLDGYGSYEVINKREAEASPPIAPCDDDSCPPGIWTRDPGSVGGSTGIPPLEKREAAPEPEPMRPMDPGNDYLACYWGYIGGRTKRGEPADEAELQKRCGKAKREASPMTDLRNFYQACYSAYVSQKTKRGEPIDSAELGKRCGKVKREAEMELEVR